MKRFYPYVRTLLAVTLVLGLAACSGGSGGGDAGLLEGQWLSQGVNASGERTRVTFTSDKKFKVEAYKKTSAQLLTSLLDQGEFKVSNSTLSLDFDDGNSVSSILQFVTDNHIMIDDMTLFRTNPDGSIAGGTISGQIRIDDGSDQSAATVGTTSALQGMTTGGQKVIAKKKTSKSVSAPSMQLSRQEVRKFFIRKGAKLNYKVKGEKFFKRTAYEPKEELKAAVQAQKTVTGHFQALSAMQTDLNDTVEQALADCKADPDIDPKSCYISAPGFNMFGINSVTPPNDPSYYRQWGMKSVNAPGGWAILDNMGSLDIRTVAIIDTGKAYNEDLPDSVITAESYDFITDPDLALDGDGPDGDPTDPGDDPDTSQHSWHGTHVAGIVGAKIDNGLQVVGVSNNAKILHLRTMGLGGNGSLPDIATAIRYAAGLVDKDGNPIDVTPLAQVINLSLGCVIFDESYTGPIPVSPEEASFAWCENTDVLEATGIIPAINEAIANDVVVVAAAGNCFLYTDGCDQAFYPASVDGVFKVGGISSHGVFATDLSHYGHDQLVVAPSGSFEATTAGDVEPPFGIEPQILSTVKNAVNSHIGTSQAAPHVAGAISAMLSINKDLTLAEIRTILEETALDLGAAGYDDKYGYGLLNIGGALERVATDASFDLSAVPDAELLVSQTLLHYGKPKISKTIFLHKVGKGDLTDLAATKTVSWIKSLDLSSTTAPAALTIEVDRTGLAPGTHTSTVTVSSSNGSEDIEVQVYVGEPSTSSAGDSDSGGSGDDSGGSSDSSNSFEDWLDDVEAAFGGPSYDNTTDIGEIIILLVKVDDNSVYAGIKTNFDSNYRFEFGALPDGQYYVLAGQQNSQGLICDIDNTPEVPCAAFPSYNAPQIITIQGANTVDSVILGL